MPAPNDVATALAAARARVVAAGERVSRDPAAITMMAVTKTVARGQVREAVAAGIRDLGENRVQEALGKQADLDDGAEVRWHLIGHLQRNKARVAASSFSMVQSLDSERIVAALASHRHTGEPPLPVLIEVDLTGLPGRTGIPLSDVLSLARVVTRHRTLRLEGLMTVAAPGSAEDARPLFIRLRHLRDDVVQRLGIDLPELSMGMSDDFEVAVEEGSTMVRLGRVLFGQRPLPDARTGILRGQ